MSTVSPVRPATDDPGGAGPDEALADAVDEATAVEDGSPAATEPVTEEVTPSNAKKVSDAASKGATKKSLTTSSPPRRRRSSPGSARGAVLGSGRDGAAVVVVLAAGRVAAGHRRHAPAVHALSPGRLPVFPACSRCRSRPACRSSPASRSSPACRRPVGRPASVGRPVAWVLSGASDPSATVRTSVTPSRPGAPATAQAPPTPPRSAAASSRVVVRPRAASDSSRPARHRNPQGRVLPHSRPARPFIVGRLDRYAARRAEVVETRGLEPLTPALQRRCSAS